MLGAAYLKSLGVRKQGAFGGSRRRDLQDSGCFVLSCLLQHAGASGGRSSKRIFQLALLLLRETATLDTRSKTGCFRRGSVKTSQVVASETGDLQLGSRAVVRAVACGVGLIGRSVYSDDTSLLER